jgi:hypothetical protein
LRRQLIVAETAGLPEDILALAQEAGFRSAQHVSGDELAERYFAGREDFIHPTMLKSC